MKSHSFTIIVLCSLGCSSNTKYTIGGESTQVITLEDQDNDGYYEDEDCDDNNSLIFPGAIETCDGIDNDCDGQKDEGVLDTFYADDDGDGFGNGANSIEACESVEGFVPISGDCDDSNPVVYPAADEICDEIDNDCDENIDEEVGELYFIDEDNDGFGLTGSEFFGCNTEGTNISLIGGDCDDSNPQTNPNTNEICDEIDNDCDGDIDENTGILYYVDNDNDGYGSETTVTSCTPQNNLTLLSGDCNDQDSEVYPEMIEICDGIDNDCNELVDDGQTIYGLTQYLDEDEDGYGRSDSVVMFCSLQFGYTLDDGDCNDDDANTFPNAEEICDEIDNDCDENIDEDLELIIQYADTDLDGYGVEDVTITDCQLLEGYVTNSEDCDDSNPSISPGSIETCDEIDNNCNELIDDDAVDMILYYWDQDEDGYGNQSTDEADQISQYSCSQPENYVQNDDDCDDNNQEVFPNAIEICDEIDNNCNALIDDDDSQRVGGNYYYIDQDLDGFGVYYQVIQACTLPYGYSDNTLDCDDSSELRSPDIPELCDGIDNNCNNTVDEGVQNLYFYDGDGDNFGISAVTSLGCEQPENYVLSSNDCNDSNDQIHPDMPETCNNIDDNCNFQADEGIEVFWYYDQDGDGFGVEDAIVFDCAPPNASFVIESGDCEPTDGSIFPDAPEVCDGTDHNCDGRIDFDADEDGYSDFDCGGDDCDDNNALANPLFGCPEGVDCLDILQNDPSAQNGEYIIDPDGLGVGEAAYEVTCDMSGGGWTLIYEDNFEQSTFNWSNNTITNCGSYGNILGGYNILGAGASVQKTLTDVIPHSHARISFDFLRLDSWDGEYAYLHLNGTQIWSRTGYHGNGSMICGREGVGGYWVYGRDEKWSVDIQSMHSASALTLFFSSTLNQSAYDESWGVDNLEVWVK